MGKERMNNTNNKSKLRKGLWSPEEDEKLMRYMLTNGQGCWSDIARNAGLQRCGKSCRLRWINYLRPDLKRGAFSPQEEELIIHLHAILGNRFSPPLSLSLSQTNVVYKYCRCLEWNTFWTYSLALLSLKELVLYVRRLKYTLNFSS